MANVEQYGFNLLLTDASLCLEQQCKVAFRKYIIITSVLIQFSLARERRLYVFTGMDRKVTPRPKLLLIPSLDLIYYQFTERRFLCNTPQQWCLYLGLHLCLSSEMVVAFETICIHVVDYSFHSLSKCTFHWHSC